MHLTNAVQVGEPKELVCLNCQLRTTRKVLNGGEFLNVITRYRVKDKDFVRQLSSDSIHVWEMKLPVLFPPKNTIEQRTVRFLSKEVNAIANFVLKKSVIKNNQSKGDKRDSWYQQNQKHPLP